MSAMLKILKDSGIFDAAVIEQAEEKRSKRNDLAKSAMVVMIPFKAHQLGGDKHKDVATEAYAYADAMLAASGDYDDN